MNRVLAAARMQVVHPRAILGIPWLVVGVSFAINWAVWSLADLQNVPDAGFTGGVSALYITVLFVFMQAVTQMLPFAMGVSLSRRTYWFGVAAVGTVMALAYGVVIATLQEIGNAMGGWGVGLDFWAPVGMQADNFPLQIVVSGAPMLACIFAGIGIGVVSKRWGPSGLWALAIAVLLLIGGLVSLATGLHAWATIGNWVHRQTLVTLSGAIPALLAVALAGLSLIGIRRVVP